MKVYVLFGQRKESYPGQYAPEVLASIDEFGNDENPDYMIDEEKKAVATGEFESVVVIPLEVNQAQIMARLRPSQKPLQATIV